MDYKDISVVYEDNHILVAVKPQNVPVQADSSGDDDMLSMLKNICRKIRQTWRGISGTRAEAGPSDGRRYGLCKTSKAAARLCKAITDGEVDKKYLAVVYGVPKDRQAHLSNYLKRILRQTWCPWFRCSPRAQKERNWITNFCAATKAAG